MMNAQGLKYLELHRKREILFLISFQSRRLIAAVIRNIFSQRGFSNG